MIIEHVNDNTVMLCDPSTKRYIKALIYNLVPIPTIKIRNENIDVPSYSYHTRDHISKKNHSFKLKRPIGRPRKK